MSQFVICLPLHFPHALAYRRLEESEELLRRAAGDLFPGRSDDVRIPTFGARDLTASFDEAHHAVANQRSFATTQLARLLPDLLRHSLSAAFWWGDDWLELPAVTDAQEATRLVVDGLSGPVGEVYLRWR
jgi:hypothetical protein